MSGPASADGYDTPAQQRKNSTSLMVMKVVFWARAGAKPMSLKQNSDAPQRRGRIGGSVPGLPPSTTDSTPDHTEDPPRSSGRCRPASGARPQRTAGRWGGLNCQCARAGSPSLPLRPPQSLGPLKSLRPRTPYGPPYGLKSQRQCPQRISQPGPALLLHTAGTTRYQARAFGVRCICRHGAQAEPKSHRFGRDAAPALQ